MKHAAYKAMRLSSECSATGTEKMVSTQKLVEEHFECLIQEGRQILQKAEEADRRLNQYPSENDYYRFRTEALNLVHRSCGEDSDHYKDLRKLADDKDTCRNSYYFAHCFGVLEAAQRAFKDGLLFDMRALIAAELLGDFIKQAGALLEAGYHIPAASLAGAVLEDTMRKLCEKQELPVPESTKIGSLNAELGRASVYNKFVQKQIIAYADIRNNADHGHFDEFTVEEVQQMVKWIRTFATDYLQ